MSHLIPPISHATSHITGGSDAVQTATSSRDGLATAAQITKLDGIEALADVTDATNVIAALAAAGAAISFNSQDLTNVATINGSAPSSVDIIQIRIFT